MGVADAFTVTHPAVASETTTLKERVVEESTPCTSTALGPPPGTSMRTSRMSKYSSVIMRLPGATSRPSVDTSPSYALVAFSAFLRIEAGHHRYYMQLTFLPLCHPFRAAGLPVKHGLTYMVKAESTNTMMDARLQPLGSAGMHGHICSVI
jgi:hypothetical protein